jgi:hypothetical protein
MRRGNCLSRFTPGRAGVTSGGPTPPLPNDVSSLPEPTGERRAVLPDKRDAGPPVPVPPQRPVSVDEMLTQLRNPDGSKRRRRSSQPIYKQRKKRRVWIGVLGAVAVLIVAGWFGVRLFQRLRLEGETFREGVNRRISTALGCEVKFTRIHDGGDDTLAATGAEFTTRGTDLIESGKLTDVGAALTSSSWFSNEWGIRSLNINSGTIKLNPGRPATTAGSAVNASVPEGEDGFRFSISPEPRIITLDAVRVVNGLDFEWADPVGNGTESIRKLTGGFKFPPSGGAEGAFINGMIDVRGLPPMTLNQLTWKLTDRHLDIIGGRISAGPQVRMEIAGKADLVPGGSLTLDVGIVDTQLRALFPAPWNERVSGSVSAKNAVFKASFGEGPERTFSGDFTVKGALFSGMAFTGKLAHFLRRVDLEVLEFPELSGHFAWSPSTGMVLTNLSAEREGFLRLAGEVTVSGTGDLRGKLKISTTELTLTSRADQVNHPFRPAEEGWPTMEFNITGTAASISDDIRVDGQTPNAVPTPAPAPAPAPLPTAPNKPASSGKDAETEREFRELIQPR